MLDRVGEKGTLLHCWWECKLVQPLWRTVWRFLKKLKNRATIWSSNPTPEHISGENHNSKRYMHPNVHCSTTIAKTWKQPKCPSTEDWIKKLWYIYTMGYYSAIKKEWNNAICSNMDGPRDYHTKSDRERQISYDITHMWNLTFKKDTNGDFPGGTVVKNPPANAGDVGSSPGPGRCHMLWSN